jgi:hypothetical protein
LNRPRIIFIFWSSKIYISSTDVVSSLSTPQCCLSSSQHRHATASCHASFLLRQDEFTASVSSFDNALSHRLPSQIETKALNSHHKYRLSSLDLLTPTLNCYKKIIDLNLSHSSHHSTVSSFYLLSSQIKAPRHPSSTQRRRSLLLLSHVHCTSVQRHPR